ncbi:MAG: VWA domain-containing protein [Flavobacteriaceae bacterium]|nr:VWA domain-containing protein [Flavobacteriaceae bacterium]
MPGSNFIMILLGAVLALLLAWWHYLPRPNRKSTLYRALAFLRFLSLFGLILLLINPKFTKTTYDLEKALLTILVDNSSSMIATDSANTHRELTRRLTENKELQDRFTVSAMVFGEEMRPLDSLSFTDQATNISDPLQSLKDVSIGNNTVTVLVSDGNQTLGQDYEFMRHKPEQRIFPVVVGDTTTYEDLRLDRVNMNNYAYLKNTFPIEIFASYTGDGNRNSVLRISMNGQTRFQQNLSFTQETDAVQVTAKLEAQTTGLQDVRVSLSSFENERNVYNNSRQLSLEVIDEKTKIVIVSSLVHPDLGSLKSAIEQNEQREVTITSPIAPKSSWEDADLLILYQPDRAFTPVYEVLKKESISTMTIIGLRTDWSFLNSVQNIYSMSSYGQAEEIFPDLNASFSIFDVSTLDINEFPPLDFELGEITIIADYETLLDQKVKGVVLDEPMLVTIRGEDRNEAILFGENSWKWRVQSFRNEGDFRSYDAFIAQLIRFLDLKKRANRLTLEYDKSYEGVNAAEIVARYFNETMAFEGNASLKLFIKTREETSYREFPMLLRNGYFGLSINDFPAGDYEFTVRVEGTDIARSGSFKILDFDVEKQLVSSNYKKMERLANASGGILFFADQLDQLIDDLSSRNEFLPVQKSNQNVVPLIDFRILLAAIAICLASEWFLRKYNGLI